METINDVVTIDAEILGGTPVFKGTRVAIRTLFDYLEESSLDEFLAGFPSVGRQQAEAVIELAAELLHTVTTRYENTPGREY